MSLAVGLSVMFTAALLGLAWLGALGSGNAPTAEAPSIRQIQQLASLVTTKIEVNDVMITTIEGRTGSLRLVMAVYGDGLIGIDLTRARFGNVDHVSRRIELVLPEPRVIMARLDHRRTRVHSIDATGLWLLLPPGAGREELVSRAMTDAEAAVLLAVNTPEHVESARNHAESALCAAVSETMNWSIVVRWERSG